MGAVVCCLLYRVYWLGRDLHKARKEKRINKARKAAVKHFLYLFVDIVDIPFALLGCLIAITGWRASE